MQPQLPEPARPTLEEALGDIAESGFGELDESLLEEDDPPARRGPDLSHPLGW